MFSEMADASMGCSSESAQEIKTFRSVKGRSAKNSDDFFHRHGGDALPKSCAEVVRNGGAATRG